MSSNNGFIIMSAMIFLYLTIKYGYKEDLKRDKNGVFRIVFGIFGYALIMLLFYVFKSWLETTDYYVANTFLPIVLEVFQWSIISVIAYYGATFLLKQFPKK
jgi:hypothetical protein